MRDPCSFSSRQCATQPLIEGNRLRLAPGYQRTQGSDRLLDLDPLDEAAHTDVTV